MSTSTATNASQGTLSALVSTGKGLVVGFGWAAIMLFVLGSWMRSKYAGGSGFVTYYSYVFTVAGAAAAALALWQAFTIWFKKETPEEKTKTLTDQRRLFSLILLAAGLAFIVLAFALGMGKKPTGGTGFLLDNLGESIGVLFFGLIALGTGYAFSKPSSAEAGSSLQFLTGMLPPLKFAQMVLAAAAIIGFAYLAYTNRLEHKYRDWLPELFTLALLSILALACFFWLNAGQLDEVGVRLFVLVFGGSLGVILFCYSFGRIIVWRNDIVFGGASAWEGQDAWHFWMCIYLQFAALLLMFGSFNLARADMRSNVVLRRMMYGYDTIVQVLLLVEILIVVNIVFYALIPYTFDWTQSRGAYAVSDASKNLIANLKKETNVVVLMGQNDPVYRDLHNLLDNFAALSAKLKVQYLSPDSDPATYSQYRKQFPKLASDVPGASGRGVLLVNGPMPGPKDEISLSPSAFVGAEKFSEDDRAAMMRGDKGKRKMIFKGESEIIKELNFLVSGKKRKVYILQGHDEPDVNGRERWDRPDFHSDLYRVGLALLAERLNKDNYEVFGLSFGKPFKAAQDLPVKVEFAPGEGAKKDVPKDCDTLMVMATPEPLPGDVVDAIERYMEEGKGKLIVFLDVIADKNYAKLKNTGLEALLKKFGVDVPDGYLIGVRSRDRDPSKLVVVPPTGSEHVLAKQFLGKAIVMNNSARGVKPDAAARGFKVETILQTLQRRNQWETLVETDPRPLKAHLGIYVQNLDRAGELGKRISPTPVSVAVAVSKQIDPDNPARDEPRLVVVGNAEFVGNEDLVEDKTDVNYSFTVSSLEWLAERKNIGGQPRENPQFTIDPSVDTGRMIIMPGWLMLVMLTSLGIGVWVVRRR